MALFSILIQLPILIRLSDLPIDACNLLQHQQVEIVLSITGSPVELLVALGKLKFRKFNIENYSQLILQLPHTRLNELFHWNFSLINEHEKVSTFTRERWKNMRWRMYFPQHALLLLLLWGVEGSWVKNCSARDERWNSTTKKLEIDWAESFHGIFLWFAHNWIAEIATLTSCCHPSCSSTCPARETTIHDLHLRGLRHSEGFCDTATWRPAHCRYPSPV